MRAQSHAVRIPAVLAAVCVVASALAGPAVAAPPSSTPYIRTAISASPNPAPAGSLVTYTGTVTPIGGSWQGVSARMDVNGYGYCEPSVGTCYADYSHVSWSIGSLTSTETITVLAPRNSQPVYFSITSCDPDTCVVHNSQVTVGLPTGSVEIRRHPAGVVMPGTIVHFTVTGSVDVGPVDADLQTIFLTPGLADPTGLPDGAVWSPSPYNYVDFNTTLDRRASYSFDAQVTAPLCSDIVVGVGLQGTWAELTNPSVSATTTIHVGPRSHACMDRTEGGA